MEPRLLLVIDSLIAGGAQRQVVRLFVHLRQLGLDVALLYYHPIHQLLGEIPERLRSSVGCLGYDREKDRLPSLALRLRKAIRGAAPTTVVSFTAGPSMLVAASRMSGLRFRWIASERSGRLPDGSRLRRSVWKRVLRRADLVVPNSYTMARILRGVGIPERRIMVVPNGIAAPDAPRRAIDRSSEDPLRLLAVGNRVPAKNHPALYAALEQVLDLRWRFDHIGRTGEYRNEDAACSRILEGSPALLERVTEHGRQDPDPWYARADLLLLPSRSEGFPNVVLEAWSWQVPVLVSNRGDLPRIVDHGRTGLVASLEEPDGLVHTLREALEGTVDLPSMGRAGRAEVEEHYTMDAIARRWLELVR